MAEEPAKLLLHTAARWGLPLSNGQLAAFAIYAEELARWNERVNLTAITQPEEIYVRHFLDSLSCARYLGADAHALIDIGSGAGFPGLPLKIVRPDLHVTLLESVAKKAAFLEHMVTLLGLDGVAVHTARAEQAGRDAAHRARYDLVTARAVAELRVLAEYSLPLLRVGGKLLAPKGAAANEEAHGAARALASLGGVILGIEPVVLPGLDERRIVIIGKQNPTSERFPRPAGVPARRPL